MKSLRTLVCIGAALAACVIATTALPLLPIAAYIGA
jgi:hypothetical protein